MGNGGPDPRNQPLGCGVTFAGLFRAQAVPVGHDDEAGVALPPSGSPRRIGRINQRSRCKERLRNAFSRQFAKCPRTERPIKRMICQASVASSHALAL